MRVSKPISALLMQGYSCVVKICLTNMLPFQSPFLIRYINLQFLYVHHYYNKNLKQKLSWISTIAFVLKTFYNEV